MKNHKQNKKRKEKKMKITNKRIQKDLKVLSSLVKAKEAADILGVSRNTAKARFKDGSVQGLIFREGTTAEEYLFYRESLEEFIKGD